ncbi:MAG: serine/threonine protein kinase [Halieaceae bacterium]|jgi:eukaryotic-like serine/threonine-protein kinase|nr:serine/threonine protein kinase [Halieaceae bacterium]
MSGSTRVGPYRILRLINTGGQGTVYLGYDGRLGRRVAIKILRFPSRRSLRKRVLTEAQLIASIASPKVVQIYDVIVASNHIALIMAYIPGCDLEELLASTMPSVASILTIGTGVSGALAAARQQRIVHGDLKARNVLITENGQIMLTDFGIARHDGESVPGKVEAGSLSCVSPEQCLGNPSDIRSDLFALGCLLYRMLTGVQPFLHAGRLDRQSLLESMPRPVCELAPEPALIPVTLTELVVDLLQKKPEDRPQNTHQVGQRLRQAAKEIPISVGNTLLEEASPFFRRESSQDVPPQVPADLGRTGRSRMRPFFAEEAWSWRSLALRASPRHIAAALVLVSVGLGAGLALSPEQVSWVHIEEPVLNIDSQQNLPAEVSSQWLVSEVKRALGTSLGPIFVTGPVGATQPLSLYAKNSRYATGAAEERIQIELRCSAQLCVLNLGREHQQRQYSHQVMLFADMPRQKWLNAIRHATLMLYKRPLGWRPW